MGRGVSGRGCARGQASLYLPRTRRVKVFIEVATLIVVVVVALVVIVIVAVSNGRGIGSESGVVPVVVIWLPLETTWKASPILSAYSSHLATSSSVAPASTAPQLTAACRIANRGDGCRYLIT